MRLSTLLAITALGGVATVEAISNEFRLVER